MSGHSKWAQIKRQKGAADIKRGQQFTKLAAAITISVRQGGGVTDPEGNFKLRLAIDRARSFNMPKENIERAIAHAVGREGAEVEEVVYEGFGPGGVAIIAAAVTDNRKRTTSEVRNLFERNGGRMATPGSVSYQFEQKGQITVNKNGKTLDDILLVAADAGAEDVEEVGESVLVYTKPEELGRIREKISNASLNVVDAELTRKPTATVPIKDRDTGKRVLSFIEKLEDQDEVQKIYSNFDISDNLFAEIQGS